MSKQSTIVIGIANIILALFLSSCSKSGKGYTANIPIRENSISLASDPSETAISTDTLEETMSENRSAEQMEHIFSVDLFKQIAAENIGKGKNLCVSPYSIYNVLAMSLSGTTGKTHKTLVRLLMGSEKKIAEVEKHLKKVYDTLESYNVTSDFMDSSQWCAISNSFWYNPKYTIYTITASFLSSLEGFPNNEVFEVNPSGETGRKAINRWTSDATRKMIPELLKKPVMADWLMANAIYFMGSWRSAFKKKNNKEEVFHNLEGDSTWATYMTGTRREYFYQDEKVQVLFMNLGYNYRICFYLPREGCDTSDFIAGLTPEYLVRMKKQVSIYDVSMEIPKFRYEARIDIFEIIKRMSGLRHLVFDNIFDTIPSEAIDAFQAFNIRLDEEGVEAAAVTVMMAVTENLHTPKYPKAEFKLNRPFFYTIEAPTTSTFLFMGAVTDL